MWGGGGGSGVTPHPKPPNSDGWVWSPSGPMTQVGQLLLGLQW